MIPFIIGAIVFVAMLSFIAWRLLASRRMNAWQEHEDRMMETITEHRLRRNFMQGG
ncbi:MAG: hypothetical protein ABFR89_04585 [Actinomycetota bacterium]